MLIMLGQNYEAFIGGAIQWESVIATYISIPIFLAVWLGYRIVHKTHFVRYEDMQFTPPQH